MLEIVLLILKIAGIILAAILGILIAGILCVLFVPVRYRGDLSVSDAEDGGKKNTGAVLRAAWLLRLIRVYITYEGAVRVRVRVFFFTVMDTAKEKKVRKKRQKIEKKKNKKEKNRTETAGRIESEKSTEKSEVENADHESPAMRKEETAENDEPKTAYDGESGDGRSAGEPDKNIKKRISNILQTIRNFCDKLKRIRERTEEIKVLWNSDHMVSSRSLLWREFLYLLRHTKPGKLEGYLRFGFDDPSTTGYAMAVYGILCSIWRMRLSVEPDFERQVLACRIKMKGKIRACHFVKTALKLFFSKDVRRVARDIRSF